MDRSSREKISKDIGKLNITTNQLDIMDTYRPLYPTKAEYTVFSSSHGIFTKITMFWATKHPLTNVK